MHVHQFRDLSIWRLPICSATQNHKPGDTGSKPPTGRRPAADRPPISCRLAANWPPTGRRPAANRPPTGSRSAADDSGRPPRSQRGLLPVSLGGRSGGRSADGLRTVSGRSVAGRRVAPSVTQFVVLGRRTNGKSPSGILHVRIFVQVKSEVSTLSHV